MEELDIADATRHPALMEAFDAAVLASPRIDHFCSSSAWVLSAHAAFHGSGRGFIAALDEGFVALSRARTSGLGRYYAALEAMWGLACPIVGERAQRVGADAAALLLDQRERWDVLWLGGIERDGPLFRALAGGLGRRAELRLGPSMRRHQAALDGGFDGWLARRSPLFRKRIRQSLRAFEREGLTLSWVDTRTSSEGGAPGPDGAALFERILAVERRSWKGLEGTGFVQGEMRAFYARMVPQLAQAGRLRVLFAARGDEDVAVCFGGVLGDTFRGLQNSFDDRFRALSLGNAMQAHTIARLCAEGVAIYDLGSEMEYKARWAEGGLETVTLIAVGR